MTAVNLNTLAPGTYAPPATAAHPKPALPGGVSQTDDTVEISPAAREVAETGRIALNLAAGNLTADQATQLYGQVSSIHSQIASGDPAEIQDLQNQLSQTIYSDAHDGATGPASPDGGTAGARLALEGGRIALNGKAGNLTSDQVSKMSSQLGAIHKEIVTGNAQAINQLENQLSRQIYSATHSESDPIKAADSLPDSQA